MAYTLQRGSLWHLLSSTVARSTGSFHRVNSGRLIQPFLVASSRDRALVYLGVEGEEQGRVLYNLTSSKNILTPNT